MGHDRGKQTPESFACKIKTELSVETLFLPDEQKEQLKQKTGRDSPYRHSQPMGLF